MTTFKNITALEKYGLLQAVPVASIVVSLLMAFGPSFESMTVVRILLVVSGALGIASIVLACAAFYFGWQAKKHLKEGMYFWTLFIPLLLMGPLETIGLSTVAFPVMALIGIRAKIRLLESAHKIGTGATPPKT